MAAASDPRPPVADDDLVDQFIDEVEALVHALRSGRLTATLLRSSKDVQRAALAELRRVLKDINEIVYVDQAVRKFNTITSHEGSH